MDINFIDPPETMNIYAPKGHKVRFAFPENGWRGDIENAEKHLTVGAVYTVVRTEVGRSITYVELAEFPGKTFNSVQFEDVES